MSSVKTTKAWTRTGTTGFDTLKFNEQTPLPELGDHDVLVKIHAASLNYRDLSLAKVS
jgi:NADPH:quinone reductase-like Zn-dependent oxidoreductase